MFTMKKGPKKKSSFLVDKISEDTFYENLLLGLPKFLKNSPFVSKVNLERLPPTTILEIRYWEHTNNVNLPEDLREFYLSSNGFSFTYQFQSDKGEVSELPFVLGKIEINSLQNLTRFNCNEISYLTEMGPKFLHPSCKIFALSQVDDYNSVVMAQFKPNQPFCFWLYCKGRSFHFLCNDFSTYLRMAIANLGIPGWQYAVLKGNLPEWSAEMFQLLAPGVSPSKIYENGQKTEDNIIDCSIFDEPEDSQINLTSPSYVEDKGKGAGDVSADKLKRKAGKTKLKNIR